MIAPEYRKQIRKIFYHYKNVLAIPKYWHVRIETDAKIKCYAWVTYDYQEKKFNIKINPKLNQDLSTLKDSILHELLHILFTPGTSRLDLLLSKLQCNEKVNFKCSKKNLAMYEEAIVAQLAKVIINLEQNKKDNK
jgi:hypothetical protein